MNFSETNLANFLKTKNKLISKADHFIALEISLFSSVLDGRVNFLLTKQPVKKDDFLCVTSNRIDFDRTLSNNYSIIVRSKQNHTIPLMNVVFVRAIYIDTALDYPDHLMEGTSLVMLDTIEQFSVVKLI